MRSTTLHIILLLLFTSPELEAQTGFAQVYTIDENDENLMVQSLHSDGRGFIWVGTKDGAYRFNGRQFINTIPDSLRSRFNVTAMAKDSIGRLWIGTSGGQIAYRQAGQWVMFMPEEGLPRKAITDIIFDRHQHLWFAAVDEGVYMYAGHRMTNINMDDGLPDNYVYSLEAMPDGQVLAGTDRGIARILLEKAKKKVAVYASRDGLPDNIVRSIAPSSEAGLYWIGMEDNGIFLYDAIHNRDAGMRFPKPWPFGRVNDLMSDGKSLWIATEDSGLLECSVSNQGVGTYLNPLPSLNKAGKLMTDAAGQLWFSTPGQLVRTTVTQMGFMDSIGHEVFTGIHALHITTDRTVWISQGKGVEKLIQKDGQWMVSDRYTFPGIALEDITTLYLDTEGILWIGTIGAGILRLNTSTGRWAKLTGNPVTENSHILSIAGKGREVWISGLNGIARYNIFEGYGLNSQPVFTNYSKRSGIGSDYVYQVFIDSRNRVWFCTDGAGLACMEDNQIRSFADSPGLKSSVVYGMTEGPEGTLWFNTLESGIVQYDGRKFTAFYNLPGNQGGSVSSILSNGEQLAIMHKRGLELLDIHSGRSIHYGRNNGINRPQVNLNVMALDAEGSVWIGMDPGIIQVKKRDPSARLMPVTLITALQVYGRDIFPMDANRFDWSDNNVTIRYEGLHYPDPDQVRFQYRLDGYHKGWITSSDREVNFPRLAPGNYRFRVRSAADNRFELGEEKTLSFYIGMPFWKTWWFIMGSSAIAVLLLWLIMRQRFHQLQQWEKLKQDKIQAELQTLRAQVNPHFLFNSFNTLMGVLEENPEQAMTYTEKLSAFYRNMLSYREKDLIPLQDEIKMLDTYIYLQQQRFGQGLHYRMEIPGNQQHQYFVPPMTMQLLAENAIKHNTISIDQPLQLRVTLEGDRLLVSNTIHRKKHPEGGEGVGLRNITARYALFTSREVAIQDDGRHFTVALPLINTNHYAHPDRGR
ncbi:MAG: histidine kinase [Chitinophagaceae bacterium]|nr:histidine kinase [Chitinophagaceae bacterium]